MSVQHIITTLNNLAKLHNSLLKIAYDKTAIIKKSDMEALDNLLKEEQSHIAAIAQMDKARQDAVSNYLRSQQIVVPEHPTVADVLATARSEERATLEAARDRLLHAIHDLKFQNDLNQQLTYQSLQFVNLSLDMVRPRQEAMNYSKTEVTGKPQSKEQGLFDSQA